MIVFNYQALIISVFLIATILLILVTLQKPYKEGFIDTSNPYGIMNMDEISANLQKLETNLGNLSLNYATNQSNVSNNINNLYGNTKNMSKNISEISDNQSVVNQVLQEQNNFQNLHLNRHDDQIEAMDDSWSNLNANVSDIDKSLLDMSAAYTNNYYSLCNDIISLSNNTNDYQTSINASFSNLQNQTNDKYYQQSEIINNLANDINTFNASLTNTNNNIGKQATNLNNLKSNIQAFQGSLNNVSTNYALLADFNNLKNNLTDLTHIIPKTYAESSIVTTIGAEIQGLSSSLNNLQINLSTLTGTVSTIQGNYVNQKDISNLTKTINTAQNTITATQNVVNIINNAYATKNDLNSIKNAVTKQESSLTQLTQSISKDDTIAQQTASNLKNISTTLASIPTQSNLTNLQYSLSNLSNTVSQNMSINTSNLSVTNTQVSNANNSITNVSNSLTSLQTTVNNLNNIVSSFQASVQNTYANKTDLQTINNTLQSQIKALQSATSSTSSTLGFLKTDKFQLGSKWSFSGIGDSTSNDNWLRMFDTSGSNFSGGIAMSQLYTQSNAYLNGNTSINGQLSATGQLNQIGSNWFPYTDSNTYIRPGTNGKDINIGDIWAKNINMGYSNTSINLNGSVSTPGSIHINNVDPGSLIEKNYGTNQDRYGVGQFPNGQTRLYSSSAYQPASINLGFAKQDGTFADALTVTQDGKLNTTTTINNNMRINSNISIPSNGQISSDGRLNIGGGDQLFVINKNGLNVSKSNGGSGNLYTDGDVVIGGKLTVNGTSTATGNTNTASQSLDNSIINNIKFSSNWTGYPDSRSNGSEIANDTGNFQQLMIVGNKSGGGERRVGIWDTLNMNGSLNLYGNTSLNNNQFRLRSLNDGAHGLAYDTSTDGPNLWGNSGGKLSGNSGKQALRWDNAGNVQVTSLNTPSTVEVTNSDPGGLIEKNYGMNDNRYGIGQFPSGQTRVYTAGATAYQPASVNLGFAKKDGTFTDAVTVTQDSKMNPTTSFNGNVMQGSGQHYMSDHHIKLRADENHGLGYDNTVDGPNLYGVGGGRITTNNGKQSMRWDSNGNVQINGLNTPSAIEITNGDPGALIEKNYGSNDNRYGIGQFPGGQTRVYTAGSTGYQPASVNLGFAKKDGTFADAVKITQDNNFNPTTTFNGNIMQGSGQHYMSDHHMKLRADENHGIGYDTSVDGPNLYGYSGGKLTSQGNTALQWDNNGKVTIPNKLQLGNKWLLSGVGDQISNDDWLRFMNVNGTNNYFGGVAVSKLWSATGYQTSDRSLKENIQPITKIELDDLDKLMTKSYNLKNDPDKKHKFGFISQDVETVYPDLTTKGPEGKQGLDYTGIIPLTVGNIKELKKRINDNEMCIGDICVSKDELKKLKEIIKKN